MISQSPPAIQITALASSKVNPSKKVTIDATVSVSDGSAFNASWSLAYGTLATGYNLPMAALTRLALASTSGSSSFNLPVVLNPAGLMPTTAYTFMLSAQNEFGVKGTSTISFYTVGPPTSGNIRVSPDTGRALLTRFSFFAEDWVDSVDAYPLVYSFFYIIGEDGPGATEYQLAANQMTPRLEDMTLPPGVNETSIITAVCYVKNVYEASARSTATVTVYPADVSGI